MDLVMDDVLSMSYKELIYLLFSTENSFIVYNTNYRTCKEFT